MEQGGRWSCVWRSTPPASELELIQPHMAQKPVLRGEVRCACVTREVSVERGGMGPGFGRLCRLWHRVSRGCSCRAAAAEVGGCSCRGCCGGSWWLFLPWLRRRKCVGEGVGTRGWMPPRQLAAAVPRGSWGVVGEGMVVRRGLGRDTRLDAATAAGCRRAAWIAGCRRRRRGCL